MRCSVIMNEGFDNISYAEAPNANAPSIVASAEKAHVASDTVSVPVIQPHASPIARL